MLDEILRVINNFVLVFQSKETEESIKTILTEGEELTEEFSEMFDLGKKAVDEMFGVGEEAAESITVMIFEAAKILAQLKSGSRDILPPQTISEVNNAHDFRSFIQEKVNQTKYIPF
jgi:endonuclease III-like uncharacterized protein